jgi:hypothetical protein
MAGGFQLQSHIGHTTLAIASLCSQSGHDQWHVKKLEVLINVHVQLVRFSDTKL